MKILIAFLLLVTQAFAAEGMAQFRVYRPGGERWLGSAVCINPARNEGEWIFLTTKHSLRGINRERDRVVVLPTPDEELKVIRWEHHTTKDVTALTVKANRKLRHVRLIEEFPTEDATVEAAGYPRGRALKIRRGSWRGGAAWIPERIIQGDSGGGIFDENNQLIGIITGYEGAHGGGGSKACIVDHKTLRRWFRW